MTNRTLKILLSETRNALQRARNAQDWSKVEICEQALTDILSEVEAES